MRTRLRRLRELPRAERLLLVRAWSLFLLAELALRVLSFDRLLAFLRSAAPDRRDHPAAGRPIPAARLAWLVEVAGRYAVVPPTCLKSALVLAWLLRRQGVGTTLRLGVARRGGELLAHAWLEHEGRVILGLPDAEAYESVLSTAVGRGDQ
ncbi:MAG: lasso peptide biosynthesis B2 protein [Candidatus Rokubacteria bacterium]|nr:lasso peptide biosynthesis B2 protein [Candidatus Rokubacteria bacterium]